MDTLNLWSFNVQRLDLLCSLPDCLTTTPSSTSTFFSSALSSITPVHSTFLQEETENRTEDTGGIGNTKHRKLSFQIIILHFSTLPSFPSVNRKYAFYDFIVTLSASAL